MINQHTSLFRHMPDSQGFCMMGNAEVLTEMLSDSALRPFAASGWDRRH